MTKPIVPPFKPKTLIITTLATRPLSLPNYDAEGNAKRISFGGTVRGRISSQAQKRSWMLSDGHKYAFSTIVGAGIGIRSRLIGEEIRDRAIAGGVDVDIATMITKGLLDAGLFSNPKKKEDKEVKEDAKPKKAKAKAADADAEVDTDAEETSTEETTADEKDSTSTALNIPQAILVGQAELDFLVDFVKKLADPKYREKARQENLAKEAAKADGKKKKADPKETTEVAQLAAFVKSEFLKEAPNFKALIGGSGIRAAFHGRFCTSDMLAIIEAAVSVAHEFTVQPIQTELDYFTVMDDILTARQDRGSAGIFNTEFTTGTYFGTIIIDIPQLINNLFAIPRALWETASLEQRTHIAQLVCAYIGTILTVQVGAKLGSTASQTIAKFALVEMGDSQARSLASAFEAAVPLSSKDVYATAIDKINTEITDLDDNYGVQFGRRYLAPSAQTGAIKNATKANLLEILDWVKDAIISGSVK